MRRRAALSVFLLAAVAVGTLPAQGPPPPAGGRGAPPRIEGEPISFMMEHAGILDLTEQQRTALMDIRRVLRRTNGPYVERLDSLRRLVGLGLEPGRGSDEDREKRERFDSLSRFITDTIRMHNDSAAMRGRVVLDSVQLARLDSIVANRTGAAGGRRGPPPFR